jgi:hypothetical protein
MRRRKLRATAAVTLSSLAAVTYAMVNNVEVAEDSERSRVNRVKCRRKRAVGPSGRPPDGSVECKAANRCCLRALCGLRCYGT